jgi:hypothetical protein
MPTLLVYAFLAVLRVLMPRVGDRTLNHFLLTSALTRSFLGWSPATHDAALSRTDPVIEEPLTGGSRRVGNSR